MRESRGGALIVEGKVAALGEGVTREAVPADARLVDCEGDVVAPGLIDMRAFTLAAAAKRDRPARSRWGLTASES